MSLTLSPALTETEQAAVAPYFTNLDGPVVALVNLRRGQSDPLIFGHGFKHVIDQRLNPRRRDFGGRHR